MLTAFQREINHRDTNGQTTLMRCIYTSHKKGVEKCIKAGANLDLKDCDGFTALIMAIKPLGKEPKENFVKMLLNAGANVNLSDNEEWSPILYMAYDNKNDPNENPLKENIFQIVNYGANIDSQDVFGWTALILACKNVGFENMVNTLLNAGANPFLLMGETTALTTSIENRKLKNCKSIIKHIVHTVQHIELTPIVN
jgi:ankyrin repeat protein